jgi:hypothetical protein
MTGTVNLFGYDNGYGTTADMDLLEEVLTGAGYTVFRGPYEKDRMPYCDVLVVVEWINAALFPYARHLVGIMNLEWFGDVWDEHLPRFDQLWARSTVSHQEYLRRGLVNAHYTGFASRDLYRPHVPRELRCVHVRGKSPMKNTDAVLEAWRRHPDLPPLTVVSADPLETPPGVEVVGRLDEEEYAHLLNACAIHVCPSHVEGWGHSITDGVCTGNAVVTTDGSPMNEHLAADLAFLVPGTESPRAYTMAWNVDPDDVAGAVRRAAASCFTDEDLIASVRRRRYFHGRNAGFRESALSLLAQLT